MNDEKLIQTSTQKVLQFVIEEAKDMRKYARDKLAEARKHTADRSLGVGQYAGVLGADIGDALTYIDKRAELIEGVFGILDLGIPDESKQRLLEQRIQEAKMFRYDRSN